jgi:hypothetical protein
MNYRLHNCHSDCINFVEWNNFWETNSRQEIPRFLWNMKVHNHVHKRMPMSPTMRQINLAHLVTHSFSKLLFNIILYTSMIPYRTYKDEKPQGGI